MTEELPTGTTWLMARTEGSARLWQTEPDEMAAALPYLHATITHLVALHGGTPSARQAACDSFVATFGRPSDAVTCALYLQLTPLDPFELCIGVHSVGTGTKRLRDIAHGGQTLISGTTASLAAGDLPSGTTLKYLGDHRMDDAERQERLLQLCHPGLRKYLQPLRMPNAVLAEVLVN
ncbi:MULTISPECIES: adenylate/guanylate cyclase domain-containing protein [unclassified Mycolicibacterium]|uniref:adenylate/guanylate cyclase domain-containing protein n=1 Tax=unclassified Mycolicibacterium TaxID=2636767 RepID=UPI0012DD5E97|nr:MULTISPECIES: adenylate/guanylate cyclase domain-containing protein [unclassified Mycolicibacterium]MUL82767.1 adenylate/guanylate cyclase domain-containing protein [Mycolicibacterium sp. CBMA 329]MUL89102.1 adenylate/guanylate cyclase domain-containing protein [Mycolicibacterium sp. CBMA 331]MUL97669.1 adenylate/guanylate cyclase domain-containing protein [Mycolicibacterium sp. CBMA 334]MUM28657.1 adenylate/guanylate cyclase domain-containing protein [Mycolicibacterium sp. CBMA 295]MUM3861